MLVGTVKADSYSLTINFIVPEDTTPPVITNIQNFTQQVNNSFYFDFDAADPSGIGGWSLNWTTYFNISTASGEMSNSSAMLNITIYYFNITVNDTLGNTASEVFYINITDYIPPTPPVNITGALCRYKYFGYWNDRLAFYKERGCI